MKTLLRKIIPKKLKNYIHLFYAWYGSFKYDNPSEELLVIGVTGTTGKSSTIHFLRQMLEDQGYKVGSLSTVDFYIAGEEKLNDQKMTMLGRMKIQEYLREMVAAKCDIAIVEVTSEGYLQHRHKFINYDTMILTGLYPEHIESHGGFENYKAAKLGIFDYAVRQNKKTIKEKTIDKVAIVNANNKHCKEFLNFNFDKKLVFASQDEKMFCKTTPVTDNKIFASNIKATAGGLNFTISQREFNPKLYGEYNVMNVLAGISVLRALDIAWSEIETAVNKIKSAPGRLEFVIEAEEKGFQVIVDYAFEPVALKALYDVVGIIKPKKVIHVCGSTGGGRDKERRRPIGKLVGEHANTVIITNEDPYDEDPMEIIKQVSAGAQEAGKKLDKDLFEILDRREAIKKAVSLAKKGDLVLITGKGSEQAMCVAGGKMISWDDREVVREFL
ncbi:MAG: UDP-N-acetylmuramyl-tripeptide synthetase [Candidatus Magasanikbacteria bacterium]|jgi:UDP-N-acetylmuramoyl-L-alanyl-D-glutamate--2,6-diaminopimelate ligase|nr:UDP-N-acetylmuramyl-tripeptide synthetase [Candidatus Magasanikbacteria bacterium]MBT4315346.1 UDP-N-acetylmuramyl-tripeptide synthetase [Candidatus Magasanikbacteria bacterium]MBT4547219.1 UDP-N-acetylmuramyl-tripeptide synthetase [Candidatus Magasanikbacteria bacterium]MBT6819459.1 UDP-N-acetylmuramyl-tripeptide synthetase [Candidatus Magasanikbacteria bacterium]